MVKNSKYILLLVGLLVTVLAPAQSGGRFNAVERDLEVTKVTFINYLKKWDEGILLNRFVNVESDYQKGKGLDISVDAENAQIYMNVQNGNFRNADGEVLDTFFSDDMIRLQQQRLVSALKDFLEDYKSYLPSLGSSEAFKFIFQVKDYEPKKKDDRREPTTSPLQHKRTYRLEAEIGVSDLEAYKNGSLSASAFNDKIKINLNNN